MYVCAHIILMNAACVLPAVTSCLHAVRVTQCLHSTSAISVCLSVSSDFCLCLPPSAIISACQCASQRVNDNLTFQLINFGFSLTHHGSFSNGAKAVDENVTGNIDWRTCREKSRDYNR